METKQIQKIDINTNGFPEPMLKLVSDLLEAKNFRHRISDWNKLVSMGKEILPYAHRLIKSENNAIRKEATKLIELIADKQSIPKLIALLDDEESDIRWIAAEGLINIGRECIVPLLKALVKCENSYFTYLGAHHVFNKLFTAKEKMNLQPLLHSLNNSTEINAIVNIEASKALKIIISEQHN